MPQPVPCVGVWLADTPSSTAPTAAFVLVAALGCAVVVGRYAQDVARGMEFLHANGLIHRDLKSPNVLIDANGRCRIADFGLSKIVAQQVSSRRRVASHGCVAAEAVSGPGAPLPAADGRAPVMALRGSHRMARRDNI